MKKHFLKAAFAACIMACFSLAAIRVPAEESVSATASEASSVQSYIFTPNTLPVLCLNIDGGEEEARKLNSSPDHSYRCTGTLDVDIPDGYLSPFSGVTFEDMQGLEIEYIRGRGNSSWTSGGKKPYKIKLAKKQDLFGMGSSKHWVLLANATDPSLLRNRLTLWLAGQMGMAYTPKCVFVDVVMNGDYLGSYCLAEQVRVEKNRVNLDELEEEMTEEPDIWGGYLLALEPYDKDPDEDKFVTALGVKMMNSTPSFSPEEGGYGNNAQRDYIRAYVQKTEDAIRAEDYEAVKGLLDLNSAADYWWIQEISENLDAYRTSSTYLYKERYGENETEGRLFFGPVWDFDYSWGNILNGEPDPTGFQHANMPWISWLFALKEFRELVKERWPLIDSSLAKMTESGGLIDQYAREISASWQADLERWPQDSASSVTLDEEKEFLRSFIDRRRAWVSENLESLDTLFSTVTLQAEGSADTVVRQYTGRSLDLAGSFPPAEREGWYFTGWYTENGSPAGDLFTVNGDAILTARYIPDEEVTHGEDALFPCEEVWVPLEYCMFSQPFTVLPADALDKSVTWSVSDENVADIDDEGWVTFKGDGNVCVTAHLSSGNEASYLLHIYSSEETPPESPKELALQAESFTLSPGSLAQIRVLASPQPCVSLCFEYEAEKPEIADIDKNGVITAGMAGATSFTVTVYDDAMEEIGRLTGRITVNN